MNVELATSYANEIHRLKAAVAKNEMMLINLQSVLDGTGNQTAFITNRKELENATRLLKRFEVMGFKMKDSPTTIADQAEARNATMTKVYNVVHNDGLNEKYNRLFVENMIVREGALNAMDRFTLAKKNGEFERVIDNTDTKQRPPSRRHQPRRSTEQQLSKDDDITKALEMQFNAMSVLSSPCSSYKKDDCPSDKCTFHMEKCRERSEVTTSNESTTIQDLQKRLTACMVDIGDIALKLKPFYSESERKAAFNDKVKKCSHLPNQLLYEMERAGGGQETSNDVLSKLQEELDGVVEEIGDLLDKWELTGPDTRRTTLYMLSKKAIDTIDVIEYKKGQRKFILNETIGEGEMEQMELLRKGRIILGDLYDVCVGEIGTDFANENVRQSELFEKADSAIVWLSMGDVS